MMTMMHATTTRRSVRLLAAKATTARPLSTKPSNDSSKQQPHLLNSASDYFATLRWKAAETLTSILSTKERQDLFQKLDGVEATKNESTAASTGTSTDTPEPTPKTIGEAVIAARAEEAKKQQAIWDKKKDVLLKQAEQAAMKRVENDIVIQQRRLALERWQRDVDREKQQERSAAEEKDTVVVEDAPVVVSDEEPEAHPLLGSVVLDMGYKRVFKVSAQTLSTIPVWKKQRIYRHDRAKVMASDKTKTPHLGLPGIIALHEDKDGRLSILDGQHRVGMMTILEERKNDHGIDLDNILVEVYSSDKTTTPKDEASSSNNNTTLAQELFTEINKAEPVKLLDMPGVATKTDRKVITQGAAKLREAFPDMFKSTQRCRAPHLNVDNLRDALFASDVIKKHNIKTPKRLVEWMLEQNRVLADKFAREDDAARNVNQAAMEKAVQYDFYLGLESSWLYN